MPNHDRFECQTAIDSDAILQLYGYTLPALSYVHVAHLTLSRFISCCSGLNTSMPLQLPLKPFLTIFMSSIRNLHHA